MTNRDSLASIFKDYSSKQQYLDGPQNLYEPVRYIMELGGKKIRPLLTLLSSQLFDANPVEVLPAAYAIELFHNFSLLHDDIMDEASLRRGKPSVHIKYGLNAGILSGDVMLVKVYDYLQELPASADFRTTLKLFNKAAVEVCEGQQLDVDFESMPEVSESLYIQMIEKKTAALLGAALSLGAIPYTDGQTLDQLDGFGRKLGIAFQLRDDLLDAFGDTFKVGKRKGGDILQNKKTILMIGAMKMANENDRKLLNYWMLQDSTDAEKKIQEVSEVFLNSGAVEYTKQKINDYQEEALDHLKCIAVEENKKKPLQDLLEELMNRES